MTRRRRPGQGGTPERGTASADAYVRSSSTDGGDRDREARGRRSVNVGVCPRQVFGPPRNDHPPQAPPNDDITAYRTRKDRTDRGRRCGTNTNGRVASGYEQRRNRLSDIYLLRPVAAAEMRDRRRLPDLPSGPRPVSHLPAAPVDPTGPGAVSSQGDGRAGRAEGSGLVPGPLFLDQDAIPTWSRSSGARTPASAGESSANARLPANAVVY